MQLLSLLAGRLANYRSNRRNPDARRVMVRASAVMLVGLLAACAGDKPTDPNDPAKVSTGSLLVTTSGLPNGLSPSLKLQRAQTSRDVAAGVAQNALETGQYTLVANVVTADGFSYDPQPASQSVNIAASQQTTTSVSYAKRVGTVSVVVTGLPSGATSNIIVTPPVGANYSVTGNLQITGAPGLWRMNASPVVSGGFTWAPSPSVAEGELTAGGTRTFDVAYAISSGAIAATVSGLPAGANGAVSIAGPNGYQRTVTATTTITDLAPGSYTVTSANVTHSGLTYTASPATQQLTVGASTVATPITIEYAAQTATLVVGVINAPANAAITVSGPGGFSRVVTSTTTIADLMPGTYTVTSPPINTAIGIWTATTPSQQRALAVGARDSVGVPYAISTGSLAIAVTGLPAGANGQIQITGPSNYVENVGATQTLVKLAPGTYTLNASPVVVNGVTYTASPSTQQRVVTASLVAAPATVTYSTTGTTGTANILVSGLPPGVDAQLTLTGPSTNIVLTSSQTLPGLTAGTYTLTASSVTSGVTTYQPSPTSQNVVVAVAVTTNASVTYTADGSGDGDDLSIAFAYVTQATQRPDGSVALVAGRDAFMRVFVVNNRANSLQPKVRVRVFSGATQVQETVLDANESSVRTTVAEGVLASSWNVLIPAANVQPDMRVQAFVDPDNVITETNEGNNVWPASGVPRVVTVQNVPAFNVRFVPVIVGALQGNVTEANKEQYMTSLRRMFPIGTINSSVRLPFTSSLSTLPNNGNAWEDVLREVDGLRATDGAPANMHYFGVVKVSYGSGIAGIGYVPGRAALGWDHLPSGAGVAAHEWGHNFNRWHSDCGNPGGLQPGYPYADGRIGMFGWNVSTGSLIQPSATDIMGYCPSNEWISDFTWSNVMTYRQSSGAVILERGTGSVKSKGLLVSASMRSGAIKIAPAYQVEAVPTAASSSATHYVEALDRRGRVIATLPVYAQAVDHAPDARAFTVVLPWSDRMERTLATIRVRDVRSSLVSASITSATAEATVDESRSPVLPEPDATVERPRADRARVRFNAQYRSAMVRDVATGQIIAFVPNSGGEIVALDGRAIDVVYSDGVRSVTRRHQR